VVVSGQWLARQPPWEEELSTKTDLSHILYYDLNKKRIDGYDFASVDVVITTYGTVQSLFESFSRSGSVDSKHRHSMFNFGWKRIILDEAHVIKNPATLISKACCTLQSETRWCVTGTPIQNSLQDVYGLLKFLRHEPWCGAAFWRNAITDPVAVCNGNSSDEINANDDTKDFSSIAAFGRVRRLLAPILLRRTKSTLTADGTPIITLPPIDYSVVHVTLSTPEREFYNARKCILFLSRLMYAEQPFSNHFYLPCGIQFSSGLNRFLRDFYLRALRQSHGLPSFHYFRG